MNQLKLVFMAALLCIGDGVLSEMKKWEQLALIAKVQAES